MRSWWRPFARRQDNPAALVPSPVLPRIHDARSRLAALDDDQLRATARSATTPTAMIAAGAVAAERALGLVMFDEQLLAASLLASSQDGPGRIVEMQTGEGKTLAAVPAVAWLARTGAGVHVLTANDYLARRDADWMRPIFDRLGLTVAFVSQSMSPEARREAYRADVTYATANEVGFDYLRDGLALDPAEQVHRPFAAVLVDEADSILIDEARVPLVIAGGTSDDEDLAAIAHRVVSGLLSGHHYAIEQQARNVVLTSAGIAAVQHGLGCDNLFAEDMLAAHTAVQDALHARALLRRDVDYVVTGDTVVSIDEFKGRAVPDRRWPAGLQTALEVKEGVRRRQQGRVLGSITLEHLIARYPIVAGMTGTARTQAAEFLSIYGLEVIAIPPHRPVIRVDHPDVVCDTIGEKERRVRDEVIRVHATGRPVLVGTASVAASERLSRSLGDLPHHVLNARNEADEAAIVARAGQRGAVTISTNMAGRGVDIVLGDEVDDLGGLHVIGTTRHESRRIDHQLRGRAGRQGDPGSSQFFVSREDPLLAEFLIDDPELTMDQAQRFVEGQHLDVRLFLHKYESVLEAQRGQFVEARQQLLANEALARGERLVRLATLDELWTDYLAAAADLRSGTAWVSMGYGDPLGHYLRQIHAMFGEFWQEVAQETDARLARGDADRAQGRDRGATWTYLTTDEPFGRMTTRIMRELVRRRRKKSAEKKQRRVLRIDGSDH